MRNKFPALTTRSKSKDPYASKEINGRGKYKGRETQEEEVSSSKPAFWNYAKPLRYGVPSPNDSSEYISLDRYFRRKIKTVQRLTSSRLPSKHVVFGHRFVRV
jgi:hypothetical protein